MTAARRSARVRGSAFSSWYSSTATSQAKVNQLQQGEAVYFVNSGDTLSAISRKFAVSALQIQYRNEIMDPHSLQIGANHKMKWVLRHNAFTVNIHINNTSHRFNRIDYDCVNCPEF